MGFVKAIAGFLGVGGDFLVLERVGLKEKIGSGGLVDELEDEAEATVLSKKGNFWFKLELGGGPFPVRVDIGEIGDDNVWGDGEILEEIGLRESDLGGAGLGVG